MEGTSGGTRAERIVEGGASGAHRQVEELQALLAMPAAWRGRSPEQIVEDLHQLLVAKLRLDLAIVRIDDEGRRVERALPVDARIDDVVRAAASAEAGGPVDLPLPSADPARSSTVRALALRPIGEAGVVVVGARRASFPSAHEALLARAACDLAALAMQSARQDRSTQGLVEERARSARLAEEALLADRRKDEFLAMLGHELRNPLAPIRTALHLVRLRGGDASFPRELAVVERQVERVARLVDDLLDVSRITQGKVQLRTEVVDLAAAVADAVEASAPLFEDRAHRLTITTPARPVRVLGDRARLAQVFGNILTNAAQYTEPGGRVEVFVERDGDRATVRVRDDGIGLPHGVGAHLFEPFVLDARTLERARGGLGLGLAIVKSLVQLHGGSVQAKSAGPGLGSELIVVLPMDAAALEPHAGPPAVEAPPPDRLARVLVVDDNLDGAELLAEALHEMGYETVLAHDGPTGLELASAQPFDAALLDIGLPVMDGYELAARLRAQDRTRDMALVALTGYGQDGDRRRALEAGFDVHLTKPLSVEVIEGALREVLERRRAAARVRAG